MKVGIIGLGQAGGRIADLLAFYNTSKEFEGFTTFTIVFNTSKADLSQLTHISDKDRHLIGERLTKGEGVGLNAELAERIAKENERVIFQALEEKGGMKLDAIIVIAGLGGGTGSGFLPVFLKVLKMIYHEPIYALGILPSDDEGGLMAYNTIRCLKNIYDHADSIILFDNNLWKRPELSIQESYKYMNEELVKPILYIMNAGVVSAKRSFGTKPIDALDVINTLHGFTALGHAEIPLPKGISIFKKREEIDAATRCYSVVRNSTTGKLTVECELPDVRRALFIVTGPQKEVSAEGLDKARAWLESVTLNAEVRGGDCLIQGSDKITGTVALSGMYNIPRIKPLLKKAALLIKKREEKPKAEEIFRIEEGEE
ncbi:MAG: tubulin/FtsZ family protein [Nitrososphaerales archaeon]